MFLDNVATFLTGGAEMCRVECLAVLNVTRWSVVECVVLPRYGRDEVLLNVYDLGSQVTSFNGIFSNHLVGLFGFFHAGIEV